MPQSRGMWAAWILACVGVFLPMGGVRADSVLDLQPSDPNSRLLAAAPATVSWARSSTNGVDHATGTLSITVDPLAMLTDPSYSAGSDSGNPFVNLTAFVLTAQLDVTESGGVYTFKSSNPAAAQLTAKGTLGTETFGHQVFTFADTNNLVTMDGSLSIDVNPTAFSFVFVNQGSNYFTSPGDNYLIAQVKKDGGVGSFNGNFFITGVGAPTQDLDLKVDIYSLSLPLPAPFYTGLIGLCGIALSTTFIKRFRAA